MPEEQREKTKRRSLLETYREGTWLLYFWNGMGLATWVKLLIRGRFDITLNCFPRIVGVSLLAPINSLLYFISEALFGARAERHAIDPPPVFILGHWRSGTTLLHELLACDPAHGYPTTYQCFFPGHFLLTGGALRHWLSPGLAKTRSIDNVAVGVDRPQEDEFALANLGLGTHYLTLAWPRHGLHDMDYLDLVNLSGEDRHRWESGYLRLIRRLSYKQKKRLVLKSPAHTARVRTLVRLFPGARFIHISRHPLAIVPSAKLWWSKLSFWQGLHNPVDDGPWMDEFVTPVFERLYAAYERDKDLIPKGHLAEIAFEDLIADPKAVLKELYENLDLGDFARAQPGIEAYLDAHEDYQPLTFEMPDKLRREILQNWAGYIDRFGYGEAASPPNNGTREGGREATG